MIYTLEDIIAALKDIIVLLCDYDGTLSDTEKTALGAQYELLVKFLQSIGVEVPHDKEYHVEHFVGTTFKEVLLRLKKELGFELEDDVLANLVDREVEVVIEAFRDGLEPAPHSLELLRDLDESGFVLSVVSSSSMRRLEACLKKTGQERYISGGVFSATDMVGKAKPDPGIYIHAMSVLDISPKHAIAIEDSPSGAISACSAGILCAGYTGLVPVSGKEGRRKQLQEAGCFEVFDDLSEITKLLTSSRSK